MIGGNFPEIYVKYVATGGLFGEKTIYSGQTLALILLTMFWIYFSFFTVTVEHFLAVSRHEVGDDHVVHVPVPLPVHVVASLLEEVQPPRLLQLPQPQPVGPVELQLLERQRDQVLETSVSMCDIVTSSLTWPGR